jgi:hypothetical protein
MVGLFCDIYSAVQHLVMRGAHDILPKSDPHRRFDVEVPFARTESESSVVENDIEK